MSQVPRSESSDINSDWTLCGVLVVTLTPALWFQVVVGKQQLLTLLALLGVYAVMNGRWLAAGVTVGAATLKFTTLPMAAILTLGAIVQDRGQFATVLAGGVVRPLANLLLVLFRTTFRFLLERRGKISLLSGETRSLTTAPLRIAGLEQWYIDDWFTLVSVLSVTAGLAVALRRENLPSRFSVAYLAASYFSPVGGNQSLRLGRALVL